MNYTRVDAKKLATAVTRVVTLLRQANDALDDLTVLLTPTQRASVLKPREGFTEAARAVARNRDLDELKAAAGYDNEAVLEDLANVDELSRVETEVAKLQQRLDDSRLLWLGEALSMSLELYGLAKARARVDASVAAAIAPLVDHLASPRSKKG